MSRSSQVAPDCIQRVELALKRNGFPSKTAFATELGMARSTITKFFKGNAVEHSYFVEISQKLNLNWQEIVYIENEPPTEVFRQRVELAQQIGEASQPTVSSANLMSVPPTLEKWLGRKREIQQLQVCLNDANIKTIGIQGLSGVGKSWLASYIYEQEATTSQFSGKIWADVSQLPDFTVFAQNTLLKLGDKSPDELKDLREPNQLIHQLLKCLKTRSCLLVIDNLETLLDRDRCFIGSYRDFFRFWQERGTPISKLLLTTQTQPALIDGLASWLNLQGLEKSDGAQLLRELGIQGTEAELRELVELVGGHPKMLRLVASKLTRCKKNSHIREAEELGLREISIALHKIKMPYRDQEKVLFVSILEEHFNNLTPELQRFLMNLSIYRRRAFNWEAAAVLLGEGEASAGYLDTIEVLEELKGRSLLDEVEIGEERKFQFHPFVWQYAKQKAGEQPEALREKVIAYYQSMTTDKSTWKTLEDVAPYLEIFYHQYELREYNQAFDTISICDDFLWLRGYNAIRAELYEQLVQAYQSSHIENERLAACLVRLGITYQYLGQPLKVIECCQQALDVAKKVNVRRLEADALGWMGNAYRVLGQYQQALNFNQQSLEVTRSIGYREWEAASLIDVGHAYRGLGKYQQAIESHQQGLELAREITHRQWEAAALGGLSFVYYSLEQYQQAIDGYQHALRIYQEVGDRSGESYYLNRMANAYYGLRQYQQALECAQKALEIRQEIGGRWGQYDAMSILGNIYCDLRQYKEAINYYQQSIEINREIGNSQAEAEILEKLQEIEIEMGNQGASGN